MLLTTFTLSLAAKATMSAQETMPGQASSSFFLASSMTSKPRRVKFGIAVFSGCGLLAVGCRRTEPSHPCKPAAMIKFSKTRQLVVATANLSQQPCQRSQIWRILKVVPQQNNHGNACAELPVRFLDWF